MHTIRINKAGGPEVLEWVETSLPEVIGDDEVLIRQTAIGVNFIDVYHRSGLYPLKEYPSGIGIEGCGVVEKVGKNIKRLNIGDRVAYVGGELGAYSEYRVLHEKHLILLPDIIPDPHVASILLKGLTARFLVVNTYKVTDKTTILLHAAAGGVGVILSQWAKSEGATVIGTVGDEKKREIAKNFGCDYVINYKTENVVEAVQDITKGRGVNVAYDSVGKDTFKTSIDSLCELGLFVSYGQSSGSIPPFDLSILREKSLYLTRPQLFTYIRDEAEYQVTSLELFDKMVTGKVKPFIGQTYYLHDAASAHKDLESRKTTGATVLIVDDSLVG